MYEFSMPCLTGYIFYEDGKVRSRFNLKLNRISNYRGRPRYRLWNDRGQREFVYLSEIKLYGQHLKSTEYETPRQVIDRILYSEKLKPRQFKKKCSVTHTNLSQARK